MKKTLKNILLLIVVGIMASGQVSAKEIFGVVEISKIDGGYTATQETQAAGADNDLYGMVVGWIMTSDTVDYLYKEKFSVGSYCSDIISIYEWSDGNGETCFSKEKPEDQKDVLERFLTVYIVPEQSNEDEPNKKAFSVNICYV